MTRQDLPEWLPAERGPDWNPITGNRPLDADVQPEFTGLLAILAAIDRPRIVLARVVQTCSACPSQWDAWDSDGQYYYLRYRCGVGTVEAQPDPDVTTWDRHSPLVAKFDRDDSLDGWISLEDFMTEAGLTLAPGAEVS